MPAVSLMKLIKKINDTEAIKQLKKGIDSSTEAILENAKGLNGNTQYFMRQNGKMKAEIVRVDNYVVTETKALAESIHQVRATADKSWAAAQNSLQAKYDMKKGEASATWTSLVKIVYDGVSYDAGMVIGAELKNGKVSTQIGFSAQTFIVYNPSNGKMEPVFAIKNGQVFLRTIFIDKGTIEELLIGSVIQSKNYQAENTGFKIDSETGIAEFNRLLINKDFKIMGDASKIVLDNSGLAVYPASGGVIKLGRRP